MRPKCRNEGRARRTFRSNSATLSGYAGSAVSSRAWSVPIQLLKLRTGSGSARLHSALGEAKSLCGFTNAHPVDTPHENDDP